MPKLKEIEMSKTTSDIIIKMIGKQNIHLISSFDEDYFKAIVNRFENAEMEVTKGEIITYDWRDPAYKGGSTYSVSYEAIKNVKLISEAELRIIAFIFSEELNVSSKSNDWRPDYLKVFCRNGFLKELK